MLYLNKKYYLCLVVFTYLAKYLNILGKSILTYFVKYIDIKGKVYQYKWPSNIYYFVKYISITFLASEFLSEDDV